MVRANKWNRQLDTTDKLQSGLGRVKEVYKEDAQFITMARVVKVNFLYNTVDVVTINYSERIMKDDSTQGRYSAQLPVSFSGSFSDGTTYGKTTPINVGDYVLIGFLDGDKTTPIVLNIYKGPDVSYQLSPTDAISGDPEDPILFNDVMEIFNLYPSQTYEWVSGEGIIEKTYQGKSFFKSGISSIKNGRINDFGYSYDQLKRTYLRGRYLTPTETSMSQVIYQHAGDNVDLYTTVFFDDNGDFRISNLSKSSDTRIEMFMDGSDSAGISYQEGSKEHNSDEASNKSTIGINKGVPSITYGNHSITFTDKDGVVVDGKPLSDWGGGDFKDDIERIEKEISDLQSKVDKLDSDEILSELSRLSDEVDNTLVPQYAELMKQIGGFDSRIKGAEDKSDSAYALANNVATTISDAAGTDESLLARLDRVDRSIKAMQDIITEVVAARTYNKTSHTYSSLGVRLDTLEEMARSDNQRLSDLIDKLDIFLSDDFSKGVASYVATIQAYGDVVMHNGQGSVTLDAHLFKGGLEWTSLLTDDAFVWTRTSDDIEGDTAWNANHVQGTKSLTLTSTDLGYGANFTVNVTVQGNLINNE